MIYDITPAIDEGIAVWPGDLSLSKLTQLDQQAGDNITLTGIKSTVHLGAHADAPSHFCRNGKSIGECDLHPYIGECQVIRLTINDGQIFPEHISTSILAPRILFYTGSLQDHKNWNLDFVSLSVRVVEFLHKEGVQLIGIDTPSIDPFQSKDMLAHKKMGECNISILEGLDLSEVAEGIYQLVALPLKLMGFDASPVRAILIAS